MEKQTDEKCEKCGSPLVLKWGKFGSFYACSNFTRKKPVTVAMGPWKKDPKAVTQKITKALHFPMNVQATVDDVNVYSKGVATAKELVPAIEEAVAKGKKVFVEQVSCDFTKENIADKPDMNTPEAQEAGDAEEYCENCGRVMVLRRGPFGPVHELPRLQRRSALQDHPQAEPEAAAEAAGAYRAKTCPALRQAAGAAAGRLRRVCVVLWLSEVQVREAESD